MARHLAVMRIGPRSYTHEMRDRYFQWTQAWFKHIEEFRNGHTD